MGALETHVCCLQDGPLGVCAKGCPLWAMDEARAWAEDAHNLLASVPRAILAVILRLVQVDIVQHVNDVASVLLSKLNVGNETMQYLKDHEAWIREVREALGELGTPMLVSQVIRIAVASSF